MPDYFDTLAIGEQIAEKGYTIKRMAENVIIKRPVLTDEERERRMERIKAAMLEMAKAMLDAQREGNRNDVV